MNIVHSSIIGNSEKDLLILHGFLGMGDNWKTHAKEWAELGYRVHLIDQRNHGRSFWSDTFSYESMVDDLAHYCKAHSLKNPILLGHSMGGKTVMRYACTYSKELSALVIADIAPKEYTPHHQLILQGLAALDFSIIKSRNQADEALAFYVKDKNTRQFLLKNIYWETPERLGLRININVLKNASMAIGEGLDSNAQSSLPTLFLKGEVSDYILDQDHLIIKHHFPNAEIKEIANAGHWLHAEQPSAFFKQVTSWLSTTV